MQRGLLLALVATQMLLLPAVGSAETKQQCLAECSYVVKRCRKDANENKGDQDKECQQRKSDDLQQCKDDDVAVRRWCENLSDSKKREQCLKEQAENLEKCTGEAHDDYPQCLTNARQEWRHRSGNCQQGYQECQKACDERHGSSSGGRRTDPCPPGTSPNPLGVCSAVLRAPKPLPPGVGGCPPGTAPGADDRCYPTLRIPVIPVRDGYLVMCPKGTKPSPIDGGCVVDDVGPVPLEPEPGRGPMCPPGTSPGPDDGSCVPARPRVDPLNTIGAMRLAEEPDLPPEMLREGVEAGLNGLHTHDPERAVSTTAERLGMEWVRDPEAPR
jgi:hypothetical protein